MPGYGAEGYGSELDKYKKMGLAGKEEGDDTEPNTEDRDQLILGATEAYEAATGHMSTETQETFQQILESVETYYDNNPSLAAETLEGIIPILEELAGLAEEDAIADKELELADEIEQFAKMAKRLEGKKPAIH